MGGSFIAVIQLKSAGKKFTVFYISQPKNQAGNYENRCEHLS